MRQTVVRKGSRAVSISVYEHQGRARVEARLYVNCDGNGLGDATLTAKKFARLGSAKAWATEILA